MADTEEQKPPAAKCKPTSAERRAASNERIERRVEGWKAPVPENMQEAREATLVLLRANKGNIVQTADEMGLDYLTVRNWKIEEQLIKEQAKDPLVQPLFRHDAALPDRLEGLVHLILNVAPERAAFARFDRLMGGLTAAVNAMRLCREQSTEIVTLTNDERIERLARLVESGLRRGGIPLPDGRGDPGERPPRSAN